MNHDWKTITPHLYKNIQPLGGDISSSIGYYIKTEKRITRVYIEFDMNEFMYMDPFYEEQKSTAPFRMNIELGDFLGDKNLQSVFELENQTFHGGATQRVGAFSNSLDLVVQEIKFGAINDLMIDVEVTYSLINSDSYACMTGTIEEQVTESGNFSTQLRFNELMATFPNDKQPEEYLKFLDSKVYDVKNYKEEEDQLNRNTYSKRYRIPYLPKGKKSKGWKFWR